MEKELMIPDLLFPSDNELEIPTLRLDTQPQGCEIPFVCFGEQRRTYDMRGCGTLHFYTDDYRFNSVYEHPEKILKHNPANIVEPNFSLYAETPLAFGMQALYKKRFIGRAMQERGIGVFVDLNVANKWYAFNLIGVPKGYRSYCTRGYADRLNSLDFEYNIALTWSDGNPVTFVVYGGGEGVKAWCREHQAVYVAKVIDIKNKVRSIENQMKNVALFSDDYKKRLREIEAELYQNQVQNFNQQKLSHHEQG